MTAGERARELTSARLKPQYILAVAGYCAFIFYLSSLSDPPDPGFSFPLMDKVAHMALYGGLAATVSVGIRRSNDRIAGWIQWGVPIGFAVLYGLTDEAHQAFVSERTWELLDVIADGIGATLAQLFLAGVFWRAANWR